MNEEKKKFRVVGRPRPIAGQHPDRKGHVHLTEREALYERAIGRIVLADTASKRRRREPEMDEQSSRDDA